MGTIKDRIEQDKKEEYAYKKMLSYGWKPHQASAIVGNLKRESNFNTSIVGTADLKRSQGVAQWHSGRLDTLKKKYGSNWTDFDNQLEFVDWELRNTHKSAGDALRQTKGVWDAGRIVTDKYEAPKVKWDRDEKRQTYVTDNYRKYSGVQLTPEDQANFLKGTAQRAIDNYNATLPPMEITVTTPQISNLDSPLGMPTLAEETETTVAQQNDEVLKAKMELQQKQNEENLFNDLLKASQIQYVDQNQIQDYAQQDQEQQLYQKGGTVLSKEQQDVINKETAFNRNWFANRKNTFDREGNPIPVEKGIFKNVEAFQPEIKTKEEMGVNYALFHPKTGVTDLRADFTTMPGTVAHERTHQYQTAMSPENWNKYVNLPSAYSMSLNTLMKDATGKEDEFTKYMRDPSEIHSFIQEVRYLNNLDPTKPVTDEMVKELKYDKSNPLKDYYSDQEIKNFLNSMVYNQPSKSPDIVAQNGGIKQTYEDWYKTVPKEKSSTEHYDLRRAYELAPREQLEAFIKDPNAHLYSVYENPVTGNYDFMKDKKHPTIKSELEWYYSSDPEAVEFRKKYKLTDKGDRYEYTKQFQQGGIIKDDMGYWNPDNWGKAVEINSPFITMKGVNEPLYIVPDVGEPKVLFPNQEYIFPRATKVIEYPLKNKNKRFS